MNTETGWISDVLRDLASYCAKNGLGEAAKKLSETHEFVSVELGLVERKSQASSAPNDP